MTPRDYARLHWDWHEDAVVEAIADVEPSVLALWPVLVAMATKASDAKSNPSGVVKITMPKLAAKLRRPVDEIERVLALMVEGELIEVEDGSLGLKRVSITQFGKWQVARRSKAAEQQTTRDQKAASRENVPESRGHVVAVSSPFIEKREEKREEEVGRAASGHLPTSVQRTIEQVRSIPGMSTRQLESNVRKAMDQFPSLPDDAVCEAIAAFEACIPEGSTLKAGQSWTKLRNCFVVARRKHDEAATASPSGSGSRFQRHDPGSPEWIAAGIAALGSPRAS